VKIQIKIFVKTPLTIYIMLTLRIVLYGWLVQEEASGMGEDHRQTARPYLPVRESIHVSSTFDLAVILHW